MSEARPSSTRARTRCEALAQGERASRRCRAVGALVALFAVLNLDEVEVNWIIGTFDTPLIVVIAGLGPARRGARVRRGAAADGELGRASRPRKVWSGVLLARRRSC